MPDRSKLTYAQALRLLARDDRRIKLLDRVLGGALLAAAPVTGGASLALIDPKTEVIGWLRDLTNTAPGRIKAARGKQHYELLEAAHTVLALSAFFDALRDEIGTRYAELEFTDAEKLHLAGVTPPGRNPLATELRLVGLSMPSAIRGFVENQSSIREGFYRLYDLTVGFFSGLSAWEHVHPGNDIKDLGGRVVSRGLGYYRDRFIRLAAEIPEFALWVSLDEHAATRAAVGDAIEHVEQSVQSQAEALSALHRLLAQVVPSPGPARDVEAKLARQAVRVLDERLWRADDPPPGLSFPTVRDGFVSPGFRLAVANKDSRPAEESWWATKPIRSDLASFLAQYLTDPDCARRPLVILGHPGAGKTLLSEVIAARMPAAGYTAIMVRLRRVDADADPHQQIETAIESAARERVSWGALCRESNTTKVVIFDGLDELIQATGVTQSSYLERIARFQHDEWTDGNSVAPVVTSRTLVMDRVRIPAGTMVVKLEEFDDAQVNSWVEAWNNANLNTPSFRPLSPEELLRKGELARQPLLLTLLAIYAAEDRVDDLDTEDLSTAELYRRLLDTFIARQVRDKARAELGESEQRRREAELRRDLAVAAFGMFNRGLQFITEDQLDRDLEALSPAGAAQQAELGEPMSRARRTAAAFFFVHVAHSDQHDELKTRRSYEFLHATFGEYLIAEYTVTLLRELAEELERQRHRAFASRPDYGVLRALLAYQPLAKRRPIVDFAAALADGPDGDRDVLSRTALELLARVRDRGAVDGVEAYAPAPFDPVRRLAAYTANLVTLAAVTSPEGVPVAELSDRADWDSTVRLWRAALDAEGQASVIQSLRRDSQDLVRIASDDVRDMETLEVSTARLVADIPTLGYFMAGEASWGVHRPATSFQCDFHAQFVGSIGWSPLESVGQASLYKLSKYQILCGVAAEVGEAVSSFTATAILSELAAIGRSVPPDLITDLTRIAVRGLADLERRRVEIVRPVVEVAQLVAECPHLLTQPDVNDLLRPDDPWSSLVAAYRLRESMDRVPDRYHARVRELMEGLEKRFLEGPRIPDGIYRLVGQLTIDMLDSLAAMRLTGLEVQLLLIGLGNLGPLIWPRIEPRVMSGLVSRCGDPQSEQGRRIISIVADYLAAHGRSVELAGLAEARAELARLAAGQATGDE